MSAIDSVLTADPMPSGEIVDKQVEELSPRVWPRPALRDLVLSMFVYLRNGSSLVGRPTWRPRHSFSLLQIYGPSSHEFRSS